MLVQQVFISPALGKVAEVRSLMEENARNNALGLTGALTRPVFGSLFTLATSSLFENMEALEKARDSAEANPQVQAYRARIETLIREPVEVTLNEIIVSGASGADGRYRMVGQFFPALGKQGEVQSILEEFTKSQQAAGRPNFSCTRRLFSSSGPIISVRDTYETLAEYENTSREIRGAAMEFLAKTAPLSRGPVSIGLRELIVRYGG